ncbi:MAG: leucine-rich repeat protein [Faecalibacterium sp.]
MKKRLISLLVALCMAVTLLPVSAITAWAEEGGSNLKPLRFRQGYPVLDDITPTTNSDGHEIYTGKDWSYDATAKVLTIAPENPTTYDLKECGNIRLDPKSILCSAIIRKNAEIVNGKFWNAGNPGSSITNDGTITSGVYSMPVINHGTITGGMFNSTVTNTGTIKGGIFHKKPENGQVADGYTLKVNSQQNGSYESYDAEISYFGNSGYVIPNSDHDTSITIYISLKNSQAVLFPIDVTFGDSNDTHCLLEDWAPNASHHDDGMGSFSVTFTAPHADADTVTLSILTRLVIDENGYPVGTEGGTQNYSGNGWKFENGTLTLESGSYDFSGEKNALRPLNPDVQLVVEPGAKLTGGAAGDGSGVTWQLTENTDDPSTYTLTIRGSGAMEDYLMSGHQPWRSFRDQITSVVVSPGVTSIGNLAFTRFSKLIHVDIADSVVSIGEHVFSECSSLTNITVPQSVTYIDAYAFDSCTNLSSITLSTNNITSIRPYTFSGCSELSSIVIPDGVTSIQLGAFSNCTKLTSITIPDSVTTIDPWAFKNCSSLTSITIPSSVTSIGSNVFTGCTSLNDIRYSGTSESVISALSDYVPTLVTFDYGDKVPEAERMIKVFVKTGGTLTAPTTIPTVSGYEFKGWLTKDDEPYDFTGAPTGRFTLYANWEKIPDQKPEPTPDPTPETYTLTVKGGTFTYNGGEAMTSANVPVDAEVKVTLNQSAVPEGMVFDLWAMDGASLLGNPAVAYNEESFTIPAGSVAKGSTVTVEAQYRDATIESEPSVLGTAAIIGVAGAGTAVIVWQGYRIGMELYEKYFQPTPEETAAEQPAPEAPAAAAAS